MATLFAPPEFLSAYSYAVDGSDPDLPKGTHLRVFAGLGAAFPLAPLAVLKVNAFASQPRGLHVTDQNGLMAAAANLSQLGVANVTPLLGDSDTQRVVRVELLPDVAGGIQRAQSIDQFGHVVAERDGGRFLFSAPTLQTFRLWGTAQQIFLQTRSVNIAGVVGQDTQLAGIRLLGLPVSGPHAWYLGLLDRATALQRVVAGAPLRLNVMDRPDGPFDAVTPDDETARVEALLSAGTLAGGLETLLGNLLDDTSNFPSVQIEKQDMLPADGGTKQVAQVPRLGNLQMAALDPGIARFLGFADCYPELPDLDADQQFNALAVAGLFVIDPTLVTPDSPLDAWLNAPDPTEPALIDLIARSLSQVAGRDVRPDLDALIADVQGRTMPGGMPQGHQLQVRAMLTVTAPTPPWLAPALPSPQVTQLRWQRNADDEPSTEYRANFAFPDAPLSALAAMAMQVDGVWMTRHAALAVGDRQPPTRATPRLFGHEQEALSRARELGLTPVKAVPAGLLADQNLLDAAGIITHRFHASDFFGRFGASVDFANASPPRPVPPPPVLRFHLQPSAVDPLSTDALSPGFLNLVLAVPNALPGERFDAAGQLRLASAMAVPAINELGAGARSVQSAALTLDGSTQSVDLSTPGFVEVQFTLPALLPQESRMLTLSATFTDTDGTVSAAASQLVKATDRRPPTVIESGIGLFWSSAPGPSPDVEVKLAWPAAMGSLHRVYATDQAGLGLTLADLAEAVAGVAPSRGRVAEVGCRKVLDGTPIPRTAFRLLTDTALVAGVDGRVVLQSTLPRSLDTVQFLRVVPLSMEGAEAPFDACGIVPIAVPDGRRGALPRLDGVVDPATGIATLSVVADKFDGPTLERDEPGLFDGGAIGTIPPEFRLRRAVGPVIDPIYARVVATGTLTRDASAAPAVRFTATATDDNAGKGLAPFVRYIYWADVRLPAERRLPAGVIPLDPPGGVTTVDPVNAADHVRLASLPSAPRVLMHSPPLPPDAPVAADATASRAAPDDTGAVTLDLSMANAPAAHALAIDQYRLAVWTQWPGQPIQAIASANGAALDGSWPAIPDGQVEITVAAPLTTSAPAPAVDPTGPIMLRLAYVDPLGRIGAITLLSV